MRTAQLKPVGAQYFSVQPPQNAPKVQMDRILLKFILALAAVLLSGAFRGAGPGNSVALKGTNAFGLTLVNAVPAAAPGNARIVGK
jgi:hypothetical protein